MKSKRRTRHRELVFGMSDDESDTEYPMYGSMGSAASSIQFSQSYSSTVKRLDKIVPRNEKQAAYLRMLETPNPPVVFAIGPAGVAKTYMCNAVGIQKLLNGSVERLVITRPAVSVDEQHGFLPGTLEDKMDPWLRPIYDVFYKFITPAQCQDLIRKQKIEICPLAYMRGRTFDNAWICADEMQNSTVSQMMMLLTRIGIGSKLVVTGDLHQHDRGFATNGLKDFIHRLDVDIDEQTSSDIQTVRFGHEDVERHPVIKRILNLYGESTVKQSV
jgi:phosphate starvation-inducible PhoH-like protein